MGQATPMKPMDAGQEKMEQSTFLNDKQHPHSSELSSLLLVKEANGSKGSVDGDTPQHNASEQGGPAGLSSVSLQCSP